MDHEGLNVLRARIAQAERLVWWISDDHFRSKLVEYANELRKQLPGEGSAQGGDRRVPDYVCEAAEVPT